ncbi:unnamed protein product [Scytosiphon promiscuus]
MVSVRKLPTLMALAVCAVHRSDAFHTSAPCRLSTEGVRARQSSSLDMGRRGADAKEAETRTSTGSSLDRGNFVRTVAAAALTLTLPGAALAVGVQPGSRTTAPPNAFLLVPALRAKLAVQNLLKLLQEPGKWEEAREALKAAPLAPADFKQCFRTYSDADPEQHLAFDLYRIQAQDALKAVSELLAYLASEKNKGSKIDKEDVQDLEEAGRSVLQGIDDFLKLAPREDVLMVEKNTADQARDRAASEAARPKDAGARADASATASSRRELDGAVAGEGAFVSGAWVGTY